MISCLSPDPFGCLGEFSDVVDELNLPETFNEEERGLKAGFDAAPGPRFLGRRAVGEKERCWGEGGPGAGE